ncbi:zinc finger, C3HC4 type (RING finger) protein [Medicago truncatula]|uniref:RING-type E3 ubiquitin transferase n=1 Tax=Medicago truncatula TaxID=3880 RepID=G7I389_MEDTR|nr:zinc finger, C3HC4 type (RING finger) protein [Medicago truncatula]
MDSPFPQNNAEMLLYSSQISVNEEAKQLPCNHLYHSGCITPWIHRRSSCPICRFHVNDNDVDDEEDEDVDAVTVMSRMVPRLLELSEDDDFYGLRITINNIASGRHALHASVAGDDGGVIGEY